jgi:hypothetical protein
MGSFSLRPDDSLTTQNNGVIRQLHPLRFLRECDLSYRALTITPVGLTPTEQTSLSRTHYLVILLLPHINLTNEIHRHE